MSKPSNSAITFAMIVYLAVVLFLMALVLKLCGVLTISWWWITSPLWGMVAFLLMTVGVITICTLFLAFMGSDKKGK